MAEMSVDLEVWSVDPLLAIDEQSGLRFSPGRSGWAYAGKSWQIVIEESIEVDAEDIPPGISAVQVGIRFMTRLELEPIGAPQSVRERFYRVARRIAAQIIGVVHDPQAGRILTARRSRPLPIEPGKPVDLIAMNWWFLGGPLACPDGLKALLAYFAEALPQFLPNRYGSFEPPKHRFQPDRLDHLTDSIFAERGPIFVWQTAGPFWVNYSPTWGPGWTWLPTFAVPHLELQCPAGLLGEPGWETALRRCWMAVTSLAQPMYSDVRILRGYSVTRNKLLCPPHCETHPVHGGWRGLPQTCGLAFAVGPPYLDQWPAMRALSEDGLIAAQSVPGWKSGGEASLLVGGIPDRLCAPTEPRPVPPDQEDHAESAGMLFWAEFWPFAPKPRDDMPSESEPAK